MSKPEPPDAASREFNATQAASRSSAPSALDDERSHILVECFQWLLDYQTPWGEWGESGRDYEERLRRAGRERALHQLGRGLAKPNMYRTLLAMETTLWLTGERFRHRITRAFEWIDRQMDKGWFRAWAQGAASSSPDISYKELRRMPDIRHTAQAVLASIRFRERHRLALDSIEHLLDCQLPEGGWPQESTTRESAVFSSAYVTELLCALKEGAPQERLVDLGGPELTSRVTAAVGRSFAWFVEQKRRCNGLWADRNGRFSPTAMVLERIGPYLTREYIEIVQTAIHELCRARDGDTWVNDHETDTGKREKSRFPTTVRVASSLILLQESGVEVDESVISGAREYLIRHYSPEEMDAPDFAYMLRVLCREPRSLEAVKNASYHDYLPPGARLPCGQREQNARLLRRWRDMAVARLEELEPGMQSDVYDYKSAFEEERSRVSLLPEIPIAVTNGEDDRATGVAASKPPDSEVPMAEGRRFRVALSFPGEYRDYVEQVAEHIAGRLGRDTVFYDKWYEHELSLLDLDLYVEGIYRDAADLVVVFTCAEYKGSEWCGLEWRAIRDLVKKKRGSEIMLVRLDDAVLPGTLSIDGFLDARSKSPQEVAQLVLKRLSQGQ